MMNKKTTFIKIITSLLVLILMAFSGNLYAQIPNAEQATTGSGLYKNKIFWLNWDLNKDGAVGDNITTGTTRTWTAPSGVAYTATVSNVVGSPRSANFDDYGTTNFRFAYNGFLSGSNTISLDNGNSAGTSSFRITVSATYPDGTVVTNNSFVIGGTESLAGNFENYQLSVPITANSLRILETYIYNNDFANGSGFGGYNVNLTISNTGHTVYATNNAGGDGRGDVMIAAEKAPYIDVSMKGGGRQHVAIGIIEELDFGDLPDTYELNASNVQDNARHTIISSFNGGSLSVGTLNLSGTSAKAPNSNIATLLPPSLRIGPTLDTENVKITTANATGDDTNNTDDEDGLTNFSWTTCNGQIYAMNSTGALAYAHIWVDKNNNGKFDATEYLRVNVPNGTNGNLIFNLSSIGSFTSSSSYMVRFRISSLATLNPYGFAKDGEIEDHMVTITVPSITPSPITASCKTNLADVVFTDMPTTAYTISQTGTSTSTYNGSSATFTIQNLAVGNYTFVVTNSTGCSSIHTASIVAPTNCCDGSIYTDSDGDGIADTCDLDDDNDGILDTNECVASNTVVNSSFVTDISSWIAGSGWGWDATGGKASNFSNGITNSILSQTLTHLDRLPTGFLTLSMEIGASDFNNASGSTATLDIMVGGVVYATITNGTARNTTNITASLANGVTSNFVTFGTSSVAGLTFRNVTFTIPYTGSSTADLAFRMNGGNDDWSVDNIVVNVCSDFDGDGVPNGLDLDSDGDGCSDAKEGAGNFNPSTSASGTISTQTPNINFGTTVDANGVPTVVGASGQGIGQSLDSSKNDCLDSDGDGYPNWQDLDDDNDGILDTNEGQCTSLSKTAAWTTSGTQATGTAGTVGVTFNSVETAGGNTSVTYTPTGAFNTTNFWYSAGIAGSSSLEFLSSWDTTPETEYTNASTDTGVRRFTITFSAAVTKVYLNVDRLGGYAGMTGGDYISNSALFNLVTSNKSMTKLSGNSQLIVTNNSFYRQPNVNLGAVSGATPSAEANNATGTAAGTIAIVSNDGTSFTSLSFDVSGYGLEGAGADGIEMILQTCTDKDTDGDGIPDYLDLDSDGDGCSDAIEGAGNFNPSTSASGTISTQTPNINFGTTVDANGVPTVVGASGQGIGQSLDSSKNDCLDSDGDGYPNWQDLDDDNDGILDTDEGICVLSAKAPNFITGSVATAVASGSGASGIPSLSYSVPNGQQRLMVVYISTERDHLPSPYGDNWESSAPTVVTVASMPTITYGGVPLTKVIFGTQYKSTTPNVSSTAHISNTYYKYILKESSGIPSGNQSFDLSAFNLPQNSGDEFKITVSTFENVGYMEEITYGTFNNTNTNANSPSMSGNVVSPTQPPSLNANTNIVLSYTMSSNQNGLTNNGTTSFTTLEAGTVNNAGAGNYNGSSVEAFLASSENDGISTHLQLISGVTGTVNSRNAVGSSNALFSLGQLDRIVGTTQYCTPRDTDGDGIPDYLDLDSDGDGCSDAIEGGAAFTSSNLQNSSMPGGNSGGSYTGTSSLPVIQNLGNTVGNTATTMGVPTIAGTGQSIGDSQNGAVSSQCLVTACYKPAVLDAGNNYPTKHGITSLGRAGTDNDNWPMIRQSAWTALEAKTKGFVVNRVRFNASNQPVADDGTTLVITSPVEGMMVYDITNNCLKVYTSNNGGSTFAWHCMSTQACPQ